MKKRLTLMCMAGIMLVGMSACGGKNSDEVQETAQTSEVVEINTTSEENIDDEVVAESGKVSDKEDYVGIQDLDIDEYVTLVDYKNMVVCAVRPVVDDDTITEYINSKLLIGNITDRAVQEGDIADIDYVGKKDGVAFNGGTASGYKLTIGSGQFIPGFEDGLVGVMPGDTVDLNLTFPEYYSSAELAGQEVVFTVTVNGITVSAEYATVTSEDLERMGLPYKTKEDVWEAGKKEAEKVAKETFDANARSAVLRKLVEESTVESIPEYLVEEETQNYNVYVESFAAMNNMDLETFVMLSGSTMEAYNEQVNRMSTDIIKQYMVMEAVARAEGIEITEEMIHEKADQEAVEYRYASGDELIEDVGFTTYRMSIVQDKVTERLMEIVMVEEEGTQETAES